MKIKYEIKKRTIYDSKPGDKVVVIKDFKNMWGSYEEYKEGEVYKRSTGEIRVVMDEEAMGLEDKIYIVPIKYFKLL